MHAQASDPAHTIRISRSVPPIFTYADINNEITTVKFTSAGAPALRSHVYHERGDGKAKARERARERDTHTDARAPAQTRSVPSARARARVGKGEDREREGERERARENVRRRDRTFSTAIRGLAIQQIEEAPSRDEQKENNINSAWQSCQRTNLT